MRNLLGEFTKPTQLDGVHTSKRFVVEVQDVIRFEGLEDVPILLQRHIIGYDSNTTHDMLLPQIQKDLHSMLLKTVSSLTPLSPIGLLYTMHAKNLSTPMDV